MPITVLKVCVGWVDGWWWLKHILVFCLSLDQAGQLSKLVKIVGGLWGELLRGTVFKV